MKKNRVSLKCKYCKKVFLVIPSRVGRAKYCSQQCSLYGSIGVHGYWGGKKRPKSKMGNAIKTMFKSGTYKRLFDDWEFLCRKCHRHEHNRLKGGGAI